MKRHALFIISIVLVLATLSCGGSTEETPEKLNTATDTASALSVTEPPQVTQPIVEPTTPPTTAPTIPPTSAPTIPPKATPTIAPTIAPMGFSRSNPFPGTELVSVPNWDVQVLETKRGADAWTDIQAANSYNEPAPEGMEYLMVKIHVKCTYNDSDEHSISGYDFYITGDKAILYTTGMASVVKPEPELDATLFSGGETEGWSVYLVSQGEGNLILVFDESWSFDEDSKRYIALDPGAAINIPSDLNAIAASETGMQRSSPIPFKEKLVTEDWEMTILEVVRGEAAWNLVLEANRYNDPPFDGYEYIAVKLHVRNIGTVDDSSSIDGYSFNITGSANILHDLPSIVEPEPALDIDLYPGGEYDGWVVFQSIIGETNLMLAFQESWTFDDDEVRYLAVDEGAYLEVPTDLNNIASTDIGKERNNPALLSEKVTTDNWEISIVEVIRGDEAWNMALAANQYNDPPEDGFEYIAVKAYVHNISTEDVATNVSDFDFNTTGSNGVLHDVPSVVDPDPAFDITLYPDGEYEGWMILQVGVGETEIKLVFDPLFEFSDESKRFISLEP